MYSQVVGRIKGENHVRNWQKGAIGTVAVAGVALGMAAQAQGTGLTSWKSGLNHDRIIQIQKERGTSFRVVSPRGISIIVDPWH